MNKNEKNKKSNKYSSVNIRDYFVLLPEEQRISKEEMEVLVDRILSMRYSFHQTVDEIIDDYTDWCEKHSKK